MKNEYEINLSTLAIIPLNDNQSKIIEEENIYIVDKNVNKIISDSCKFFGSTYKGRHDATKYMIGVSYKSPIIIEESNEIIFFPTSSPRIHECCWISLKHIDRCEKDDNLTKIHFKNGKFLFVNISYGSIQNQILRSSLLRSILIDRKFIK